MDSKTIQNPKPVLSQVEGSKTRAESRRTIQNRSGRSRLQREYFVVFGLLLGGGLITSGLLDLYFRYRENRDQIEAFQREVASGAATRIAQFILTIEGQLRAAAVSSALADKGISQDYQFELEKLTAIAPSISEVTAIDGSGQPLLFVSRFRVALSGEEKDFSKAPGFLQAKQGANFFGSVYFLYETEPYMNIAVPIERFPGKVIGVLQAQVNLRHIWEVVRDLTVGDAGRTYIVTRSGHIIAHSNPGLVLQRRSVLDLPQVKTAFQPSPVVPKPWTLMSHDLDGHEVLSSVAFLPSLDWAVIVDQPLSEAYAALWGSILRTSALLLIGAGVTLVASLFIGRHVVRPLEVLRRGIERIGAGDLSHRIEIKTGNEIEMLADEFNKMVGEIKNSYQNLEEKVRQRTKELSDSLAQQTAVASTLRVMASSPSNLQAVFDTILADAARFTRATGVVVRLLNAAGKLTFVAHFREDARYSWQYQNHPLRPDENSASTRSIRERRAVQVRDIQNEGPDWRGPVDPNPWHTALAVPLIRDDIAIGAIVVLRDFVEPFTNQQVELLTTLADQLVVAIKNATLFQQRQERTRELEIANIRLTQLDKLKSSFISNVSHELRTPLTAIGSLVDNMLDGLTGALNAKQFRYMGGIKDSTERLARLIHDLLDLSVIESGKIELKNRYFSLPSLIHDVAEDLQPVAQEKGVALVLPVVNGNHIAWADRDKITQVLTNLITNAVNFTSGGGQVKLTSEAIGNGRWLQVGVIDNGCGIPKEEAQFIFDEFYQISQPGEKKAAGIGLGLAICKKLIDMHGGQIWVESEAGSGSAFYFTVPAHQKVVELGLTDSAKI